MGNATPKKEFVTFPKQQPARKQPILPIPWAKATPGIKTLI